MIILAGVSINAVVGDNGIIAKAQYSSIATRLAKYKEELEMNMINTTGFEEIPQSNNVTALNDNVKTYIPSLLDSEIGEYGIVAGELYYLGEDENIIKVCSSQSIKYKESNINKKDYIANIEKQAIESLLQNKSEENLTNTDEDGNKEKVGIQLIDKNLNNANWKIIIENTDNKIYGSGWYYVESGTSVDRLGILKNNYIINYDTKSAVVFNESIHTILNAGEGVAVKHDLILNIDPSLIENAYNTLNSGGTINEDEFGEGVVFHGYGNENGTQNLKEAFTQSCFKFDGIDDYIEMPYNYSSSFINGSTFEIFCKLNKDTTDSHYIYSSDGSRKNANSCSFIGLFTLGNGGNLSFYPILRYGFYPGDGNPTTTVSDHGWLYFNPCPSMYTQNVADGYKWNPLESKWGNSIDKNQSCSQQSIDDKYFSLVDEIDLCVTVNIEESKMKFYINGEIIDETSFDKNYYQEQTNIGDLYEGLIYNIGRATAAGSSFWHYLKGSIYSLKLYNVGLTDEEVKANYNTTLEYHKILEKGGNAETGDNITRESFDNIEVSN